MPFKEKCHVRRILRHHLVGIWSIQTGYQNSGFAISFFSLKNKILYIEIVYKYIYINNITKINN